MIEGIDRDPAVIPSRTAYKEKACQLNSYALWRGTFCPASCIQCPAADTKPFGTCWLNTHAARKVWFITENLCKQGQKKRFKSANDLLRAAVSLNLSIEEASTCEPEFQSSSSMNRSRNSRLLHCIECSNKTPNCLLNSLDIGQSGHNCQEISKLS